MTENEWLASDNPGAMAGAVAARKRASARVLRLYMAAFWGWQSHRLPGAGDRTRLRRRSVVVEEWAETGVAPAEAVDQGAFVGFNTDPKNGFLSSARAPAGWRDGAAAVERAVWTLREVFGNPFATRRRRKADPRRGSMFDAAWRTSDVLALARSVYDNRDFGAMPILADALQDAGCDNDDILTHCRGTGAAGEHVRGCWVLDLVLKMT